MKVLPVLLLLVLPCALFAQTETFDIVTYKVPSGWTRQVTDYAISFSSVNKATGEWCQMAVYKSVAGSGVPANDFSGEWKALIKPSTYAGAIEPLPSVATDKGWTRSLGTSKFQWQQHEAYVSLLNISGYGSMVSVVVSMNSNSYSTVADDFLKSIILKTPDQSLQPTLTISAPSSPIAVTETKGTQGIVIATTNFDDGWVSQPFADFVKVEKGGITVRLHYAVTIDDEMRRAENMAILMWNRLVATRYRASTLKPYKNEMYTYNTIWFAEGDATDVQTGRPVYAGLRVLVANGVATCIEIIAPNAAALQKEFADQGRVEAMVNYNKFAVSPADIVGSWNESSSTGINYYNTVTGGYAGTNTSASANSFTMRADGTYDSHHKGAFGMTGNMTFYDEKYNGKYTLTPWDVAMTNRSKGRTDTFSCQYEAVRGGRVLLLRDKTYTAMTYRLVKVK